MKKIFSFLILCIIKAIRGMGRRVNTNVYRLLLSECGNLVSFDKGVKIYYPQNIIIGNDVCFNYGVILQATPKGKIKIGNHCTFSYNAMVITAERMINNGIIINEHKYDGINIGNNVWICAGAIVLPGSIIDDNVIVASGAVVIGHLKSGWIYAGVPAKPKKEL